MYLVVVVERHREGNGGGGGRIGESQIVVGAVGLSLSHCVDDIRTRRRGKGRISEWEGVEERRERGER